MGAGERGAVGCGRREKPQDSCGELLKVRLGSWEPLPMVGLGDYPGAEVAGAICAAPQLAPLGGS